MNRNKGKGESRIPQESPQDFRDWCKLNGGNIIKEINTWAVSLLRYF